MRHSPGGSQGIVLPHGRMLAWRESSNPGSNILGQSIIPTEQCFDDTLNKLLGIRVLSIFQRGEQPTLFISNGG
jgi:hypothetical protein